MLGKSMSFDSARMELRQDRASVAARIPIPECVYLFRNDGPHLANRPRPRRAIQLDHFLQSICVVHPNIFDLCRPGVTIAVS
jgi:hypothetical protein